MHDLALIVAGFLVGMVVGLTGVGGGSLPGIWIGARLMQHTPERVVRSLLSVLLAYAGFKLIAL